jgi:methylmalonyl-CoA mutase
MNNANKHKIRIVTAASLFDGHDASINIMRRILQAQGAEIIHLGHNRTAQEIVSCAIEEDAQAIAVTSYQGGHIEFFSYMRDLLVENGYGHIKIFGGGGGTILPEEIEQLHAYGITKIYSPDDGRRLGLEGMIKELISLSDFEVEDKGDFSKPFTLGGPIDVRNVARAITRLENQDHHEIKLQPSTIKFLF